MQSPRHILTIAMVSAILLQCGSKGPEADASTATPKTPTDKLVADLKAEYGLFTRTFYDSLQRVRFIEYSYRGGRNKPDLFRQSINKSLNQVGQEVNLKYDVSSAAKVNLGEYVWETPAYRVNLHSSVKVIESPAAPDDSVFKALDFGVIVSER